MRLPFMDRYIRKKRRAFEMEEIIDKTLREFLRNPGEDAEQIGDFLATDSEKTGRVLEEMARSIPVFCRIAGAVREESDDTRIAAGEGVILPYVASLREIAGRQQLENSYRN